MSRRRDAIADEAEREAEKRGTKDKKAKELVEKYEAVSFAQWLEDEYPQYYDDVRTFYDAHFRTRPEVPGAKERPIDQEQARVEQVLEHTASKDVRVLLQKKYKNYKKQRSEDYAEAVDEAIASGQVAEDYDFADKAADTKAFDKRLGSTANDRVTAGADTFQPGETGGTSRWAVNMDRMSEMLKVNPDLGDLLTESDVAGVFGGGDAASSLFRQMPISMINQERAARPYDPNRRGDDMGMAMRERDLRRDQRSRFGGSGAPGTRGLGSALTYLQSLTTQDLTRLQQHLALTGMFDEEDLSENRILWGYAGDENTMNAWRQLINESTSLKMSIADVIHQRQVAYAPRAANVLAGFSEGQQVNVTLSDPDTIRSAADNYFQQYLGRAPTEAERDALISSIHGMERAVGQQKLAALRTTDRRQRDEQGNVIPLQAGDTAELEELLNGGRLAFPVAGPNNYGNDWGQARSGGRHHAGTDIFAATGTPIVAAKAGTVRHLGSGGVQGHMLSVSVTGNDTNNYFYNHMDPNRVVVREGQTVTAGQVIGYVGDGGLIGTSSHLHFSINEGRGDAQNPFPLLQSSQGVTVPPDMGFGPETQSLSELGSAALNTITEVEDVDVQSSVEQAAQREHPVEFGAQRLGDAYEDLTSLLRGGTS